MGGWLVEVVWGLVVGDSKSSVCSVPYDGVYPFECSQTKTSPTPNILAGCSLRDNLGNLDIGGEVAVRTCPDIGGGGGGGGRGEVAVRTFFFFFFCLTIVPTCLSHARMLLSLRNVPMLFPINAPLMPTTHTDPAKKIIHKI